MVFSYILVVLSNLNYRPEYNNTNNMCIIDQITKNNKDKLPDHSLDAHMIVCHLQEMYGCKYRYKKDTYILTRTEDHGPMLREIMFTFSEVDGKFTIIVTEVIIDKVNKNKRSTTRLSKTDLTKDELIKQVNVLFGNGGAE